MAIEILTEIDFSAPAKLQPLLQQRIMDISEVLNVESNGEDSQDQDPSLRIGKG